LEILNINLWSWIYVYSNHRAVTTTNISLLGELSVLVLTFLDFTKYSFKFTGNCICVMQLRELYMRAPLSRPFKGSKIHWEAEAPRKKFQRASNVLICEGAFHSADALYGFLTHGMNLSFFLRAIIFDILYVFMHCMVF